MHARPAGLGMAGHVRGNLQEFFAVAIAARQQEYQGFFRQVLYRVLLGRRDDGIRLAGVPDDGGARNLDLPYRGDEPSAPVAEAIAIEGYRNTRVGRDAIRYDEVGGARVM